MRDHQSHPVHWLFLLETTAPFVVSVLPKYVSFSPGINFRAPKQWMPLSLFRSAISFFSSHRECTEASNWGGAIQSALRNSSPPPKPFYAFLHHRDAADDFLPLTPSTDVSLLCVGLVHISDNSTEFPIQSFIEVFCISFREFLRLVGPSCS